MLKNQIQNENDINNQIVFEKASNEEMAYKVRRLHFSEFLDFCYRISKRYMSFYLTIMILGCYGNCVIISQIIIKEKNINISKK